MSDGRAQEEWTRQQEEKIADNEARQIRLGHVTAPVGDEEDKPPKPKAKPRTAKK